LLGEERDGSVPVVVEERVFVFFRLEGGEVGGEEGEVGGHGEESQRVGEGWGEQQDLERLVIALK
jgi:hypothetical protein